MFVLLKVFTLASGLSAMVAALGWAWAFKSNSSQPQLSPFECGFTPSLNSRNNFSLQFFLVTLIFLIFDVELVLLFPVLVNLSLSPIGPEVFIFYLFLLALSLGLFWEWGQSMLEWYSL